MPGLTILQNSCIQQSADHIASLPPICLLTALTTLGGILNYTTTIFSLKQK